MVSPETVQTVYFGIFFLTAAICFISLRRVKMIEDVDTRRGLGALLLLSGLWAATQAARLLAPASMLAVWSYTTGLVVGLATVGAWLYFCSAYANYSYHRRSRYRWAALGVYIVIVLFKLSNPWHGLYFETTVTGIPFRHIAIQKKPAFWTIAGLSYGLSAVGFYFLLNLFDETRVSSQAAKAVVGVAALPVAFDIIGYLSPPPILEFNYESIGVALFAIGVLYIVREPFFAVSRYGRIQLVETLEDAILILDPDGRIKDYNDTALELFPQLQATDLPLLEEVIEHPDTRTLDHGDPVKLRRNGETRYYIVKSVPITVGATDVGRGIALTDVTEIERQRRDLERKDEQLEGFAKAITHELRNSVGIINGQAELLSQRAEEIDDPDLQTRSEKIRDEGDDLVDVVDQLQMLARYSQAVSEADCVSIDDVVHSAERRSDVELDVTVENSVSVEANEKRLRMLFKQAFRFAAWNGISEVAVRECRRGFEIAYEEPLLDGFNEDDVFAYGNAIPNQSSAMLLPNLQTLATSHGWETEIVDGGTIRIILED